MLAWNSCIAEDGFEPGSSALLPLLLVTTMPDFYFLFEHSNCMFLLLGNRVKRTFPVKSV